MATKSHIRERFTAGASGLFYRSNKCAFTGCTGLRFSLRSVCKCRVQYLQWALGGTSGLPVTSRHGHILKPANWCVFMFLCVFCHGIPVIVFSVWLKNILFSIYVQPMAARDTDNGPNEWKHCIPSHRGTGGRWQRKDAAKIQRRNVFWRLSPSVASLSNVFLFIYKMGSPERRHWSMKGCEVKSIHKVTCQGFLYCIVLLHRNELVSSVQKHFSDGTLSEQNLFKF